MTMLIVKCIHKCHHINRISVAVVIAIVTILTTSTATAAAIITIMSLVSIEIQTKCRPLIHQTVSCHSIRIRTISQTLMYRFMFDKHDNDHLAAHLSYSPSIILTLTYISIHLTLQYQVFIPFGIELLLQFKYLHNCRN